MTEQTLADVIDGHLRDLEMTQETLAGKIGVPGSTLRTWMHRNRFPRDGAEAIGGILFNGMSLAEMEAQFRIEPRSGWAAGRAGRSTLDSDSLLAVFRGLDRQWAKVGQLVEGRGGYLADLFRRLCERSLFVFMGSSVTPIEFEAHRGEELRAAIAAGVASGGTLLYLRPTEEVVAKYVEYGFQRILEREDFEREIVAFRKAVAELLVEKHAMTPNQARTIVRRSTPQFYFCNSVYYAPGFSIGFFQTPGRTQGQLVRRMTLRVPGTFGGVWYLPEDPLFAGRFSRCVHQALAEQKKELNRRTTDLGRSRWSRKDRLTEEAKLQEDRDTFDRIERLMRGKL
jgi:hypothetical protein